MLSASLEKSSLFSLVPGEHIHQHFMSKPYTKTKPAWQPIIQRIGLEILRILIAYNNIIQIIIIIIKKILQKAQYTLNLKEPNIKKIH